MSKFKALITTLILGSSSVALADTSFSFKASAQTSWGTPSAPLVRDHRISPSYRPAPAVVRGTWITLAEPMSGNAMLRLQSQAQFNQIRIQSASGASFISTVNVRFADGSRQLLTLNRWIDSRNPMLQFNLDRTSRVDRISINGSANGHRSSYQVFGYGTQPIERPMPHYQGVMLGQRLTLANTDGRALINVDKQAFSSLRLVGTAGRTHIESVYVQFADGQQQRIDGVNRDLRSGETVDLTLDSRARQGVIAVVVKSWSMGSPPPYSVGEFSLIAL